MRKKQLYKGFLLLELSLTLLLIIILSSILSIYAIKTIKLQKESLERLKLINNICSIIDSNKFKNNNNINNISCVTYKKYIFKPIAGENFYFNILEAESNNINNIKIKIIYKN